MLKIIKKIITKICCGLDEHTPKDEYELEHKYANRYRSIMRCKYCNKKIEYSVVNDFWYEVRE